MEFFDKIPPLPSRFRLKFFDKIPPLPRWSPFRLGANLTAVVGLKIFEKFPPLYPGRPPLREGHGSQSGSEIFEKILPSLASKARLLSGTRHKGKSTSIPSIPRNAAKPAQLLTGSLLLAIVCRTLGACLNRESCCSPLRRKSCPAFARKRTPRATYLDILVPHRGPSGRRLITHARLINERGTGFVSSMASGLDASSLHPTGVALPLCPLEQRFHQGPESPVPLVLR